MSEIVVQAYLTLDGVVQGGGGPHEDDDGGFPHGGWAADYDAAHGGEGYGNLVEEWESRTDALLLGRRTYEIFAGSWGVWDENADGFTGELTRRYNRVPKYVASRTLTELSWVNSHLLGPDLVADVRHIREQPGREVRVWGSTELVRTLGEHDLVDEYRLAVYPLVLGTGKRLFTAGFTPSTFALAESWPLSSGVVVSRYRRRDRA
ncbi:dihydrofolate reductase family protein [Georgenia satyanarayanai]|uniref:dihydrofolate reductase family protein n=1 Tax=Georgenia satyanarayanai TaxID=860221 RepID=UPI0020416323|nr:dihydrofolate reductase family protein [Georgenia satyanarayanai]MCM3661354.1 dihydrofolate reductase family protein [Georgenia satyanarayanai]